MVVRDIMGYASSFETKRLDVLKIVKGTKF